MARPICVMLQSMRVALLSLCMLLGAPAALAQAALDEGPLTPCTPSQAESGAAAGQPDWGIEIAGAFSKDEALAEFDQVKQAHSDLLGSYAPMVVETCDLHLGTALRYSARIGMDSRDAADALCAKLQAAGGACVVEKN
jgi:hypothetical protein